MLRDSLNTVTSAIAAELGEGIDVESHPGRFTEEELGKVVTKKRAVRVAIEAVPKSDVQGNGLQSASVTFAAIVITGDRNGQKRHDSGLEIVEQLLAFLPFNRFEQQKFQAIDPSTIEISNLYSGDLNGKGIAMWAIGWTQSIRN